MLLPISMSSTDAAPSENCNGKWKQIVKAKKKKKRLTRKSSYFSVNTPINETMHKDSLTLSFEALAPEPGKIFKAGCGGK